MILKRQLGAINFARCKIDTKLTYNIIYVLWKARFQFLCQFSPYLEFMTNNKFAITIVCCLFRQFSILETLLNN